MARVALVKPSVIPDVKAAYHGHMGLSFISSYLKGQGHKVLYCDKDIDSHPGTLDKRFADFKPEFVGVNVTCDTIENAAEFIKGNRKDFPGTKWIVGGPEVTQYPRETLEQTEADIGVMGDGIPTIQHIIEGNLERAGIIMLQDGKFYSTGMAHYDPSNWRIDTSTFKAGESEYPALSLHGCDRKCGFCNGRQVVPHVVSRKLDDVVADMKAFAEAFPDSDYFYFNDENFLMIPKRLPQILEAMDKEGLKHRIGFQASADYILNAEAHLREAGERVLSVVIGAESFDNEQLRRYEKGTTAWQNHSAIELLRGLGISTRFFMIVGDAGTTIEELCRVSDVFVEHPEYFLLIGEAYVKSNPLDRDDKFEGVPDFLFKFRDIFNGIRKKRHFLSYHLSYLAFKEGARISDVRKGQISYFLGEALRNLKKFRDGEITEAEADKEMGDTSDALLMIMNHLYCCNHVLDIELERETE